MPFDKIRGLKFYLTIIPNLHHCFFYQSYVLVLKRLSLEYTLNFIEVNKKKSTEFPILIDMGFHSHVHILFLYL